MDWILALLDGLWPLAIAYTMKHGMARKDFEYWVCVGLLWMVSIFGVVNGLAAVSNCQSGVALIDGVEYATEYKNLECRVIVDGDHLVFKKRG